MSYVIGLCMCTHGEKTVYACARHNKNMCMYAVCDMNVCQYHINISMYAHVWCMYA